MTKGFAHQDRIFAIESSSGRVQGIPSRYGEILVSVDWNKKPGAAVKIKFGSRVLNLPACVSKYFMKSTQEKMRITGSWYHDRSTLPPYLSIELPDKSSTTTSSGFVNGRNILMNLETAEIIEIEETIVEANGKSMQSKKIEFKEDCSANERKHLIPSVLARPKSVISIIPATGMTRIV